MIEEVSNKVTMEISEEKKNKILQLITNLINEYIGLQNYEMSLEDKYELYFGGNKLQVGAFVNIIVYNRKDNIELYNVLREKIREVYVKELKILSNRVFVQYDDYDDFV